MTEPRPNLPATNQPKEHHDVILVGSGPGSLGVAAVLEGWRPRLAPGAEVQTGVPELQRLIEAHKNDLLEIDPVKLLEFGLRPIEFFRSLHHPTQNFQGGPSRLIEFERSNRVDWLMLTDGEPGGLWNGVPRNQLTLSPGHWMELAPYRMADFFAETGRDLDPNDLILKRDLVPYYHTAAERLGLCDRMRTGQKVIAIRRCPSTGRFEIESRSLGSQAATKISAAKVVFGVGPRAVLRRLNVPGDELGFVSHHYDHWDDYPGKRVLVVGGGRSADWAATELHDAGREVIYVMRQGRENHERLINESQNLPYYRRIREIIDSGSPRLELRCERQVVAFREGGDVVLNDDSVVSVDHAVVEIGGEPNYELLRDFGPLKLHAKRDRYRFQLMQLVVHPDSFESADIPGLYPAGYLAQGTGLSVIGFHAQAYPMGAHIRGAVSRE